MVTYQEADTDKPMPEESRATAEDSQGTRQPVIFLHLQKTAGSALRHYFGTSLARDRTLSELSHEGEVAEALARYAAMTADEKARLKVIFGHMASAFRPHFPDAPLATIVRDPFDRALSQYFYERRHVKEFGWREEDRPLPHEVSLKEFMDGFLAWGTFDDAADMNRRSAFQLQTRTIAHFVGTKSESLSIDDIPALVNAFDFIGVQNEFAVSTFLFFRRYDLPARPIPFVNSYSDLTRPYFPDTFARDVRAASAFDTKLYELALERLQKEATDHFSDRFEWRLWNTYRLATEKEIKSHLFPAPAAVPAAPEPPEPPEVRYVSATVPVEESVVLADGINANVATISLTPGTWDIGGMAVFTGNRDTLVKYLVASLSLSSATIDGTPGRRADVFFASDKTIPAFYNGCSASLAFPTTRFHIPAPTTLYLVALGEFGAGSVRAFGTLSAWKA